MLEAAAALPVEYMCDVMAAGHQGGPGSRTLYTNVYDLANRVVYLYFFYDYEHVVVIDLEEELVKGAHAYDLPALFPSNPTAQQFSVPILRRYRDLIQSRLAEVDPAFLAAYVGDYELPEKWGGPDEWISVVPHGASLLMIFPDSHRYELFPQGETSFFTVLWRETAFQVGFDVNFGVDPAGRVLYLEAVFGADDSVRHDRLGPDSFVPYMPTPARTSTPPPTTTPPPTATAEPTPAPSAAPTAATPVPLVPAPSPGFPWGWAILPVVLLAALGGWVAIRRRRSARR